MQYSLGNRAILITGGSTGIGKAVARACVYAGADVFLCARRADVLEQSREQLQASASGRQRVLARTCDVSHTNQVERLMEVVLSEMPNLSGLVNCAGILGPKGNLDEMSIEEWIATVHVNLIAVMLLCRAVLPYFRGRRYGKIINFSGGGATSPRPRFSAYAASKAAVVRLTENLACELAEDGIRVNAVAPGAVNTRMLEEVLEAGPARVGDAIFEQAMRQKQQGGVPAERAAQLCVMLLSDAGDGISGRLLSAVWDDWESLPSRAEELAGSDLYTLRRVVPRDRA